MKFSTIFLLGVLFLIASCSDTSKQINSEPQYDIGVTVSGLIASQLELLNNSQDLLRVDSNGISRFSIPLQEGEDYFISIQTQPVGLICSFDSPQSGTMGSGDKLDILISCADNVAPSATILYPPSNATTSADTLNIVGRSSDLSSIVSVKINSVLATSNDNFNNWRANIPIAPGSNSLIIETEDSLGNIDSVTSNLTVQNNGPVLENISDVLFDSTNNLFYALDSGEKIYEINGATGYRRILYSKVIGTGEPINFISSMDVDFSAKIAYVTSGSKVIQINLNSASASVVADLSTQTSNGLRSIVLDETNNRLLVVNPPNITVRIYSVDLNQNTFGDTAQFFNPQAIFSPPNINEMIVDDSNNRLIIMDSNSRDIYSVNLTTGVFIEYLYDQSAANITLTGLADISYDATANRTYVSDSGFNAIYSINDNGNVLQYFSSNSNGSGVQISKVGPLAASQNGVSVFMLDTGSDNLISINANTKGRQVISSSTLGNGLHVEIPRSLCVNQTTNKAYLVDSGQVQSQGRDAVIEVDLLTANRRIVADPNTGSGTVYDWPGRIACDSFRNKVYFTNTQYDLANDSYLNAIIEINMADLSRRILKDYSSTTSGFLDFNINTNQLMGIYNTNQGPRVTEIDQSGNTRYLTASINPENLTGSINAYGFAFDPIGNTSYLITSRSSLVSASLENSNTALVSNNITHTGTPFSTLNQYLAVDRTRNRIILNDLPDLITVDISTGVRSTIQGVNEANIRGDALRGFDPVINMNDIYVLVLSGTALFAVELESGDRVIISK